MMKIGDYEFINLSQVPSGPMQSFSRETRTGVNGVTLWDTGYRSEVVQLQSVVDCADVPSALQLLKAYEALTKEDPVPIFFAGDALDGLKVKVLRVEALQEGCHATVIGLGGTKGTSNAMLRCAWILQPVHAKEARS